MCDAKHGKATFAETDVSSKRSNDAPLRAVVSQRSKPGKPDDTSHQRGGSLGAAHTFLARKNTRSTGRIVHAQQR
jgi:hypothetical protein